MKAPTVRLENRKEETQNLSLEHTGMGEDKIFAMPRNEHTIKLETNPQGPLCLNKMKTLEFDIRCYSESVTYRHSG
jgi:hypothetical protein